MILQRNLVLIVAAALIIGANGCSGKSGQTQQTATPIPVASEAEPTQLPARYQKPGYVTAKSAIDEDLAGGQEAFQIRVGATIKSTSGPQPLWDVLKRLANLKGMTVSWASDVDQNYMVDVDINAQDFFQDAVANLLRQADYFHETQGRTIVVKNKTTKTFHVGVPYTQGNYRTYVGGNLLPDVDDSDMKEVKGTVEIENNAEEINLWANIRENLQYILDTAASERAAMEASKEAAAVAAAEQAGEAPPPATVSAANQARIANQSQNSKSGNDGTQRSLDGSYFIVDKTSGTVTVTAKPSVMSVVENYFSNLKDRLYRQISIEAKVVEVVLNDHSKIGLDWSGVLENLNVRGQLLFGSDQYGQSQYGRDPNTGEVLSNAGSFVYRTGWRNLNRELRKAGETPFGALRLIRGITLQDLDFNVLLNALDEQGESRVLSNPKLTVLNGQPALLSVGKVTKYLEKMERKITSTNGGYSEVTFTTNIKAVTEGVSLGVIATLVDDENVILQLTPVTTELEGGYIPEKRYGPNQELLVGLPIVNVRELTSTVQVADGELLVIGGLIDNMKRNVEKFPPVVGKIPLVKYLFGYEEKTDQKRELVVLLTPKIL